jgi:oligopeptide transport system permease protein
MIAQALWQSLKQDARLRWGGGLMALLVLGAYLLPWALQNVSGYAPEGQNLLLGATPPSWQHPFGTDFFGRDVAMRTLMGLRVSLAVGLCSAAVAALVGTAYGATSGFVGGRIDGLMMRVVDVLYALPYMFLVILLVTLMGKSIVLLFVALGLVGWLMTARIVRGRVLALKEQEFVMALTGLGASKRRIIVRHLIPNTLGAVLVVFTLSVPTLILEEAFLSFLGLGVQAPDASLGSLVSEGIETILLFWWLLVFPATVLALLLLALNVLGDAIRDALDPKGFGS